MKIAAYVHLHRTAHAGPQPPGAPGPTGVTQHMVYMVKGLTAPPFNHDVRVIAPREQLDPAGQIKPDNLLHGLPVTPIPFARRWLELGWETLGMPKADRWAGEGADWIYCPAESYVATRRVPVAVTVHDTHAFEDDLPYSHSPSHLQTRKRWTRMFRAITRGAKRILAVSEFTQHRLTQLFGVDPNRISIVGNGIDDAYFDRSPVPRPASTPWPYVMVVGGLTMRKGGDYILDAARLLREVEPDLRIVVSGKNEPDLLARAKSEPNVVTAGYLENAEVIAMLKHSVALLFPSRYEGFGIPAIEAMACGTPVITTRRASLPEVVGDAGIYVDLNDPRTAVDAIRTLARGGPERDQLIARGFERAATHTWPACVARLNAALSA